MNEDTPLTQVVPSPTTSPLTAVQGPKEERILQRIRETFKATKDSDFRHDYQKRCEENENRYQANRSVSGLQLGPDPAKRVKNSPWNGCADIGIPLEMILIQQLHPRAINAFGMEPMFESYRISDQGFLPAGDVDDLLHYKLVTTGELKRVLDDAIMMGYKNGDPVIKPSWQVRKRYVVEERIYLLNAQGGPLLDPERKPIEVIEKDQSLVELIWQKVILASVELRTTAQALAERDKITEKETIMAVLGFMFDEKARTVTQVVPSPLIKNVPNRSETVYTQGKLKVTESVIYQEGVEFELCSPERCFWPIDAKTNDPQKLPWFSILTPVDEAWLRMRIKPDDDRPESVGFDKANVELVISKNKTKADSSGGSKNIEVVEHYDAICLDEEDDELGRKQEIIAWYAVEDDLLLGWITNPNSRNKSDVIRPIFPIQPRPEPGRYHAISIPDSVKGCRDVMDALFNQMLDQGSIQNNPPLIVGSRTLLNADKYKFGPGARWWADTAKFLDTVNLSHNFQTSFQQMSMLTLMVQQMWGANELFSGNSPQYNKTGTLGELKLQSSFAGQMFEKQIVSIANSINQMIEYVRNLYGRHKTKDGYRYVDRSGSKATPTVAAGDKKTAIIQVKTLAAEKLNDEIITRVRNRVTEGRREEILRSMQLLIESGAKIGFPALKSLKFVYDFFLFMRDTLNLEEFPVPTYQEVQAEMMQMQAGTLMAAEKARINKILDSVKNEKLREQLKQAVESGQIPQGRPGQESSTAEAEAQTSQALQRQGQGQGGPPRQ